MLPQLLNHSPAVKQLHDEGYRLEVRSSYLLVRRVPYLNAEGVISYGDLIESIAFTGDALAPPDVHTVWFSGTPPYDGSGRPIDIVADSQPITVDETIQGQHRFSHKPPAGYRDHHHKLSTYASIIATPAMEVDSSLSPQAGASVLEETGEDPIFRYMDNASTRAGIVEATNKLRLNNVAIIGLGGTGSYILDLISKMPIKQLHLFDGDELEQHNAFRAPGAASKDEVEAHPKKVDYYVRRYEPMRFGLVSHPYNLGAENASELANMNFVFIAADAGPDKKAIVQFLVENNVDFIDVGMGLQEVAGVVGGQARISIVAQANREQALDQFHIPTVGVDRDEDYDRNIQVADMNMLSAALAVIQFKKLTGFCGSIDHETKTVYTLVDNALTNEAHDNSI